MHKKSMEHFVVWKAGKDQTVKNNFLSKIIFFSQFEQLPTVKGGTIRASIRIITTWIKPHHICLNP